MNKENNKYKLKINCTNTDKIYMYNIELSENNIYIYKHNLSIKEPFIFHNKIYKLLSIFFKRYKYQFSSINNNTLKIYFDNNFEIKIIYNNIYDKLFFEDLINNIKRDIIEVKYYKKKK